MTDKQSPKLTCSCGIPLKLQYISPDMPGPGYWSVTCTACGKDWEVIDHSEDNVA